MFGPTFSPGEREVMILFSRMSAEESGVLVRRGLRVLGEEAEGYS